MNSLTWFCRLRFDFMCLCQWCTIIQLCNISYRAWFGSTQYRDDSTFDCLGSCCNTILNPLALGPEIANWPLWHDHQHHGDSCRSNCSRPLTQQVPWRNPTRWALWTTCILLFWPWIDVHPKKKKYDNGKFSCRCKCSMGLVHWFHKEISFINEQVQHAHGRMMLKTEPAGELTINYINWPGLLLLELWLLWSWLLLI